MKYHNHNHCPFSNYLWTVTGETPDVWYHLWYCRKTLVKQKIGVMKRCKQSRHRPSISKIPIAKHIQNLNKKQDSIMPEQSSGCLHPLVKWCKSICLLSPWKKSKRKLSQKCTLSPQSNIKQYHASWALKKDTITSDKATISDMLGQTNINVHLKLENGRECQCAWSKFIVSHEKLSNSKKYKGQWQLD